MTFKCDDDAFAFAIPWTRKVIMDLNTIMTRCACSDEVEEELKTAHAYLVKAYNMMKDDVENNTASPDDRCVVRLVRRCEE